MSDRLNEALRVWGRLHRSDHNLNEIKAAARAYADLVNGERVEPDYAAGVRAYEAAWLEWWDNGRGLHQASPNASDTIKVIRAAVAAVIGDRLLIDPPKEEE